MRFVRLACFALVALLALSGAAYAQETPSAGVFVGMNHSYFSTNPENDTTAKNSLVVGAFAVLRKDKGLKIQPEVQYSQRRVGVDFNGTEVPFSIDYLNMSLMTRLKLYKQLYTSTGVQFSIPLKGEMELAGKAVDVKDNIKSDISIPVGVGVQINKRIGIEGRWDAGLKSVEEAPLGNTVKRNRAITFMALIGF
jgi:hypothetical protein